MDKTIVTHRDGSKDVWDPAAETHERLDNAGNRVSIEDFIIPPTLDDPDLDPIEIFNQFSSLDGQAVLAARELIKNAGSIWEALLDVPMNDPTKPFLDVVTSIVLEAALPLLE
jgi:hypothetical protein